MAKNQNSKSSNRPVDKSLPESNNDIELKWINTFSNLLDSKFRIPGTNIRFGIDPIIGLVPIAGDIATVGLSLSLIYYMSKYGASGKLVIRMATNVLLDFLIGKIPFLGYFFDFVLKANDRNVLLLKEYYFEEKHKGTGLSTLVIVFSIVIALVGIVLFGVYQLWSWIAESLTFWN